MVLASIKRWVMQSKYIMLKQYVNNDFESMLTQYYLNNITLSGMTLNRLKIIKCKNIDLTLMTMYLR